ncbi:hypothetical protein Q8F55_002738 [Vanrija albida]|uniref:Uncharacterized protein n=1 Tax=Vanrija albida TaxID=181172 RepID=A0ABR3QAQ6_9TREE
MPHSTPPQPPSSTSSPALPDPSPSSAASTNPTTPSISDDEAFRTAYNQRTLVLTRPLGDRLDWFSRRATYRLSSPMHETPYEPAPGAESPAPASPNPAQALSPPAQSHAALGIGTPPTTPTSRAASDPAPTTTAEPDPRRTVSDSAPAPPLFVFGASVPQPVPVAVHPRFDFSRPLYIPEYGPNPPQLLPHPDEPGAKRVRFEPPKPTTWTEGDTRLEPSDGVGSFMVDGFYLWAASAKLRREYRAKAPAVITFTHPLESSKNIALVLNAVVNGQLPLKVPDTISMVGLLKHWECKRELEMVVLEAWRSMTDYQISRANALSIAEEVGDWRLARKAVQEIKAAREVLEVSQPHVADLLARYHFAVIVAGEDMRVDPTIKFQQAWAERMAEMKQDPAMITHWRSVLRRLGPV